MVKKVYVAGYLDANDKWHLLNGKEMPKNFKSRMGIYSDDDGEAKIMLAKSGMVLNAGDCVYDKSPAAVKKLVLTEKEKTQFSEIENNPVKKAAKAVAYTDGSYNKRYNRYGYGVLFSYDGKDEEFSGGDTDTTGGWQVNGEIFAVLLAVVEAINQGCKEIEIRYDYEGVRSWAEGYWKTNRQYTVKYAEAIRNYRKKIKITFKHIPSHTGDPGNERADKLAKTGAFIDVVKKSPVVEEDNNGGIKDPLIFDSCHIAIKSFYKKQKHSFKDYLQLKTGGYDGYSKMSEMQLKAEAESSGYLSQIKESLDDEKQQAAAIRWRMRGLSVDDAIHKVKVDAEVSENAKKKRK